MSNTDSTWKRSLPEAAAASTGAEPGRWLGPFRSGQADGTYLVGDHATIADRLDRLARASVSEFGIDTPTTEAEFQQLGQVVRVTRGRLLAHPSSGEL